MKLIQYFILNESLQLKTNEYMSIENLFEKLKAANSGKLKYHYKISDTLTGKISPKIIWGGFQDLCLSINIEPNKIILKSRVDPSMKMIIVISAAMLIAFSFQLTKERIPLWIFPLIIFLPFYFQLVVNWQLNKLSNNVKDDLVKSDLIKQK